MSDQAGGHQAGDESDAGMFIHGAARYPGGWGKARMKPLPSRVRAAGKNFYHW
jgi:hypothetical protein